MAISRFKTSTVAQGLPKYTEFWDQSAVIITPPPVSGYTFWLNADDASKFTYSSSNVVSAWADGSTSANNATQATVANQPTRESSVLNGKAVVRFNSTKLLKTGTRFGGQAQTTFMVINTASGIDNATTGAGSPLYSSLDQVTNLIAGGIGFGSWTGGYSNERINWSVQTSGNSTNGVAYTSANISSGGHTLVFVTGSSGSGRDILLDNSSLSLTAVNSWTTTNYTGNYDCIGNTNSATDGFKGDIAELIFYPSQLSSGDITSVNNYLKAKWGTP
jgi:hypothetical protein